MSEEQEGDWTQEQEREFQRVLDASAYTLGDDGTMNTVLIENNTGEEEPFMSREGAMSFLLSCGPVDLIESLNRSDER